MSGHRCFSAAGLLLILWAIVCQPAAAQITFSQLQFYPAGTRPGSPAIGDFNGDGIPDIAVVDGGNSTVTDFGGVDVLLGNGNGTFQPAKRFSAFANPNSIALGDFNGDGKLDIVVLAESVTVNDSRVAVLLGNGDGTFQPAIGTVLNPVQQMYKFAVGDFDGDGKTDLVVYNYGPITIWTSKGDGTFQPAATYTFTSFIVVGSIWVSDLNGDGNLDLLLGGYTGNPEGPVGYVGVMLGNGDGTFQNSQNHSLNSFTDVTFVQGHNFTGSGTPDAVAAASGGPPSLQILPNNGDGTLQPAQSINTTCQPDVLAVGDFDGDHKPDLAALCESEGALSWQLKILLGNGDRTFQPAIVLSRMFTDPSIAVADLNGDGLSDVVAPDANLHGVVVMLNSSSLFSLAPLNPHLTVSRGGQVSEAINVTAHGSFNSAVALSCSVSTPQASCLVSPSSVMPGSSATLTVNARTASALLNWPGKGPAAVPLYGVCLPLVGLVLVGAGGEGRKRGRKAAHISVMGVLVALLLLQAACGGGGSSPTPAGTYTVTITGTSGTMTRTTRVSLTVQ